MERMEKCYELYVIDVIVDWLCYEREFVCSLFKKQILFCLVFVYQQIRDDVKMW